MCILKIINCSLVKFQMGLLLKAKNNRKKPIKTTSVNITREKGAKGLCLRTAKM